MFPAKTSITVEYLTRQTTFRKEVEVLALGND